MAPRRVNVSRRNSVCLGLLCVAQLALAQIPVIPGPPSEWGPDDQRGALNYLTPEVVAAAAGSIRSGKVFTLQVKMANPEGDPVWPGRSGAVRINLMDEGLTAESGVYGSTFYILTGFHGAHVIAGLCLLLVVFIRLYWGDFTPRRHLIADASAMYWHFVDVVWVFLYVILYIS